MTRQYQLGKRAVTAAETRSKVLAAARHLFGTLGFRGVSMDAVARTANVGRTTVFEQFQSKSALFEAVADDLSKQVFASQFLDPSQHSLDERLHAALHGARPLWGAELLLFRRLHGMALLEPTDSDSTFDVEARRIKVSALAHDLIGQHRTRTGVTAAELIDALMLLTSFAAYSQLRRGRGEADDVAVAQLVDLLIAGMVVSSH